MTNEIKAERLEEEARKIDRYGTSLTPPEGFAALLRESAALMREQDNRSLLTGPDWKTMYEAQERDLAALRQEQEGLREKAELLEWYLGNSERCAWLCGMLGQPFSWFQEPKPQALSALRAARGGR